MSILSSFTIDMIQLDNVLTEVEKVSASATDLYDQLVERIETLEALREKSENVNSDIQDYVSTLTNIQDSIDEFANIKDEASNYSIGV